MVSPASQSPCAACSTARRRLSRSRRPIRDPRGNHRDGAQTRGASAGRADCRDGNLRRASHRRIHGPAPGCDPGGAEFVHHQRRHRRRGQRFRHRLHRGIGQIDYANSIDPGVGTYVDGVYLGRAVGGNLDLPDVQDVEVLRGPQGTLFGKNTMGGAINVTTRRPSFTDRASVALTIGEYNRVDEELDADVKFSDRVAMHADFVHRHHDGFIERYYGGDALGADDRWIGRVKLEIRVDETLNILLSGDFTSSHGSNPKISRIFDPLQVEIPSETSGTTCRPRPPRPFSAPRRCPDCPPSRNRCCRGRASLRPTITIRCAKPARWVPNRAI